jgi:hypothetical protein
VPLQTFRSSFWSFLELKRRPYTSLCKMLLCMEPESLPRLWRCLAQPVTAGLCAAIAATSPGSTAIEATGPPVAIMTDCSRHSRAPCPCTKGLFQSQLRPQTIPLLSAPREGALVSFKTSKKKMHMPGMSLEKNILMLRRFKPQVYHFC